MLVPVLLIFYFLGLAVSVLLTAKIEKKMTILGILLWGMIYIFWPIAAIWLMVSSKLRNSK